MENLKKILRIKNVTVTVIVSIFTTLVLSPLWVAGVHYQEMNPALTRLLILSDLIIFTLFFSNFCLNLFGKGSMIKHPSNRRVANVYFTVQLIFILFLNFPSLLRVIGFFDYGAQKDQKTNGLWAADLSPDDSHLVFSYFINDIPSIYFSDSDGSNIKLLVKGSKEINYSNPKFSSDGRKILFLSAKKGMLGDIYVINSDGSGMKQITYGEHLITDAIFSTDDKKVIYIQAQVFKHYSPIGVSAPHNCDIYEHDLENNRSIKLTNFKAYSINTISQIKNRSILMVFGIGGMYEFSIGHADSLHLIMPVNDPRKGSDMYYDPSYSERLNKLAFSAPYEIYIMDFDEKVANKIYRNNSSDLRVIKFYNNQDKILFMEGYSHKRELKNINIDGSGINVISLKIDSSN